MVVVYMEAPGMSANTYQLLIKHHWNYNKCNMCVYSANRKWRMLAFKAKVLSFQMIDD